MSKPSLIRLLTCTLLFALISLMPTTSFADTTTGTIRGTVMVGSKRLSGVNVRLFSPSQQIPIDFVKTDSNGEYVFTDVAPGKYQITTQITGYQDQVSNAEVSLGSTNVKDFNLAGPPPRDQVNIEIVSFSSSSGCVEGYVSDVKSIPRQTTILCLIDRKKHIYAVTEPGAQGRFAFSLIPPGDYRLDFQHPGYPARQTFVSVFAGQTSDFMYSPLIGWAVITYPIQWLKPSNRYVHLRNSSRGGSDPYPKSETTAPAYGTAVLIR